MRKHIVAIACSDIHLTLTAPIARSKEPDWFVAQSRPLKQLREIASEYEAPILCAGDIFNHWNSNAELINWASQNLPFMYAIPGQHDLPYHDIDLLRKSAYMSLIISNKIYGLSEGSGGIEDMNVQGFPWGSPLREPEPNKKKLNVALIHQYVWIPGKSYPTAPGENKLDGMKKKLKGWDVVIFGDNHKGFITKVGATTVINCGGLQRRKSDEIDYKPMVGLIYEDGTADPFFLDCSMDVIEGGNDPKEMTEDMDLRGFLDELTKLQDSGLDFREAMIRTLQEKKPGKKVEEIILKSMG
jgi:DNA repair exonuclease SbcCD nuclease subunit